MRSRVRRPPRILGHGHLATVCRGYRRWVLRWLLALVVTGVLSTFAVLLLIADYDDDDGRVLLHLTETHGVHTGDLFIVAGWAVALAALLGLLVVAGRRPS